MERSKLHLRPLFYVNSISILSLNLRFRIRLFPIRIR